MARYKPLHQGVKLTHHRPTFRHRRTFVWESARQQTPAPLCLTRQGQGQGGWAMETVLPDAQPRKAGTSRVCRMKEEMKQLNTQKCTVLPVSDGIQGVTGKPEVGNGEKNYQPYGLFKKMTARSGWDDQIRVFLQPR